MTRLHAITAAGLFSLLLPTIAAASSPVETPPQAPGDGPWTYVAIFDGRGVFFDKASLRRGKDDNGRDYIAVRTLIIEADGALLVTLDTDCAAGMQRVGDIVKEDPTRKRTGGTDGVSEWGNTTPGQAGDRIRQLVCSAAGG